jgi:hypothetical protein
MSDSNDSFIEHPDLYECDYAAMCLIALSRFSRWDCSSGEGQLNLEELSASQSTKRALLPNVSALGTIIASGAVATTLNANQTGGINPINHDQPTLIKKRKFQQLRWLLPNCMQCPLMDPLDGNPQYVNQRRLRASKGKIDYR